MAAARPAGSGTPIAHVPVTYLLNTRDRPVRPEAQEEMVTHLPNPPHIVRLDTGHIPAVTDPQGFARLLASVLL